MNPAGLSTAVSAAALASGLMLPILGPWSTYRDTADVTGAQTSAIRTASCAGVVVVLALAAAGRSWETLVIGLGAVAAIATAYGTGFSVSG